MACCFTHLACFNPDILVAYILPSSPFFKLRLGGFLLQEVVDASEESAGARVVPCPCFHTAHREAVYVVVPYGPVWIQILVLHFIIL